MGKAKRQLPQSTSRPHKGEMAKASFKMKTEIGQHVLKNPGVAQAIVDKAELKQSDTVLEVGPGTGNLTVRILQKVKKVTSVELDPRMAAEVTKRVQGKPEEKRLQVLLGDVIKTDLPYFDVCISNTPYQISSPLTFKLLAMSPAPRVCILMFQREFALRLFARPGDSFYSRLSANAQMWAHIDHIMNVGRNNFRPPPQVESAVVRLVPKVPRPQISYDEWDGLLRICFMRKNRTIRANFLGASSVLELLEENWRTWCAQHDIAIDEDVLLDAAPSERHGDAMEIDGTSTSQDLVDEVDAGHDADSLPTAHSGRRKARGGKVASMVREKVRRVIEEETKLAEKRARNCDQGDFLNLLWEFNKEGIHFA